MLAIKATPEIQVAEAEEALAQLYLGLLVITEAAALGRRGQGAIKVIFCGFRPVFRVLITALGSHRAQETQVKVGRQAIQAMVGRQETQETQVMQEVSHRA